MNVRSDLVSMKDLCYDTFPLKKIVKDLEIRLVIEPIKCTM